MKPVDKIDLFVEHLTKYSTWNSIAQLSIFGYFHWMIADVEDNEVIGSISTLLNANDN